jgi:hypothetical protein
MWGIIIGALIGAVVIFLITRELWCWYWKINKGIKLLEDQNKLLKQLLIHFGVSGISLDESPKPSVEKQIPSIKNDEPPEPSVEEQISSIKNEKNVQSYDVKTNEVKIIRLKSVVGSALLINVRIDNEKEISLENGGTETIKMQNGKHTITAAFNNDFVRMDFEINNNGKVFSIIYSPPLKINEI